MTLPVNDGALPIEGGALGSAMPPKLVDKAFEDDMFMLSTLLASIIRGVDGPSPPMPAAEFSC